MYVHSPISPFVVVVVVLVVLAPYLDGISDFSDSQVEVVPLNDKGREITEEDDIFIDDPRQMVSFALEHSCPLLFCFICLFVRCFILYCGNYKCLCTT